MIEMTTTYWVIYGIGVVLFPFLFGLWARDVSKFDIIEDCLPIVIMGVLWPFGIVMVLVVLVSIIVGLGVAGMGWFLIHLGGLLSFWKRNRNKSNGQTMEKDDG